MVNFIIERGEEGGAHLAIYQDIQQQQCFVLEKFDTVPVWKVWMFVVCLLFVYIVLFWKSLTLYQSQTGSDDHKALVGEARSDWKQFMRFKIFLIRF